MGGSDDVIGGWILGIQNADRQEAKISALESALHDTEQALAEKDREIVKWSELIGSFTRSQHRYLVEMERLKQALAEKDREIQQIREHEFQRGYQEAEEKYQQILEKSVNTEGAAMTRKEELESKARQFMETQDRYPYLTAIDMLYKEFLQVEREVWERSVKHFEKVMILYGNDNWRSRNAIKGRVDWCRDQQELA